MSSHSQLIEAEPHQPFPEQPRLVEVRKNVLRQNDIVARELRQSFHDAGVFVVSLVSSPGSGKTAFLERTLAMLRPDYRVAALVGDLATDNHAARLSRAQVPVRQLQPEAAMVRSALEGWKIGELDFLFIENVGNLVCPSSYDIGEDLRAVLLSVTEGEDKPLKYPTIFNIADPAVITKMDLAAALEFDLPTAESNIQRVRPRMPVMKISARSGEGMGEWLRQLASARARRLEYARP